VRDRQVTVERAVGRVGREHARRQVERGSQTRPGGRDRAQPQRPHRGDQLAGQRDPVRVDDVAGRPGRLGGEPGVLLDAARQHRAAERGRGGEPADIGDRRVRDVLQDHDARAGRRVGGQERGQAGEGGLD